MDMVVDEEEVNGFVTARHRQNASAVALRVIAGRRTIAECVNMRIALPPACRFGPLDIRHLRRSPRESNPVALFFFGGQALTGLTAGLFTEIIGWFFDNKSEIRAKNAKCSGL